MVYCFLRMMTKRRTTITIKTHISQSISGHELLTNEIPSNNLFLGIRFNCQMLFKKKPLDETNLVIVIPSCSLYEKVTMRCKFSLNFVFNIWNRNRDGFNLFNDMIQKSIDKRVNIPTSRRSDKLLTLAFSTIFVSYWDQFFQLEGNPPSSYHAKNSCSYHHLESKISLSL